NNVCFSYVFFQAEDGIRDAVVEAARQRRIGAAARDAEVVAPEVRVLEEARAFAWVGFAAPHRPGRIPSAVGVVVVVIPVAPASVIAVAAAVDRDRRDLIVPSFTFQIGHVVAEAGRPAAQVVVPKNGHFGSAEDT